MLHTARRWSASTGVLTAALAATLTFGGIAAADPVPAPVPPQPAPLTPDPLAQHTPATAPAAPAAPSLPQGATPAAPKIQPLVPATSDTLRDYFAGHGVELQVQQATGFDALDITLPVPTGWTRVPDPNVPDAFVVIANRNSDSLYTSNAALVVYRLVGDFDPREAITHGNIEAQQLPAWRTTDQAIADYAGQPAARIEGTFRQNDMTLNTARRTIIATSGADRYLVSLSVTSAANLAVADATAAEAILTGFSVRPPADATPGPATAPGPTAPAATVPGPTAPAAAAPAAVPGHTAPAAVPAAPAAPAVAPATVPMPTPSR